MQPIWSLYCVFIKQVRLSTFMNKKCELPAKLSSDGVLHTCGLKAVNLAPHIDIGNEKPKINHGIFAFFLPHLSIPRLLHSHQPRYLEISKMLLELSRINVINQKSPAMLLSFVLAQVAQI